MASQEQGSVAPPILVRKEGAIGWVTLNRPDKRNAITFEMQRMIPEIMADLAKDQDIRVVILTGAGDQAFSAGADITEFREKRTTTEEAVAHMGLADAAMLALFECPKPVIAMINGVAVGNGYMLAMHCDLRIAADTARVGITSARLGMDGGITRSATTPSRTMTMLAEVAGLANAKEVMLTGRLFPADRALRMGLVNEVVPAADLERRTREVAAEIAGNAPQGVASAKAGLNLVVEQRGHRAPRQAGPEVEPAIFGELNKDYFEGVSSFLEKRKPRFQGE